MARTTALVDGARLVLPNSVASPITVDTPEWFAWLEHATTFAFTSPAGRFTARKERQARGGSYWKAYRTAHGTLHRVYLGKAQDLTLDRLNHAATTLAAPSAPAASPPAVRTASPALPVLVAPPALPEGTLTFLFTDIVGSTTMWEAHPQAMAPALARHDAILQQVITASGGIVFKTVGDAIHAVFTAAPDALDAALAAQHALHHEPWGVTGPLRVRMAIHTGAADMRDGDYFGPSLNRIARMLGTGHGGQILLSHATAELVQDCMPPGASLLDLGAHQLKDLSRPEQIFQLVHDDLPTDFPPLTTLAAGRAPAAAVPNLLATKLFVPPARANLIVRPRLFERLEAGLRDKLTLIAAPAGFGKTTLLSAWRATAAGSALLFGWVSLDSADNDPLRFWSYLITALDMLAPGVGTSALGLLQSPQTPPIEGILTSVLNALSAAYAVPPVRDMALVLDDYHVITAPAIHGALALLLDYLPPQLHLVLLTRADPALPMARLRARGVVTELHARDLRFTPDEAAAFLNRAMGLALTAADLAALEARTEGWIAGLQLAALAMRDHQDRSGFIRSFTGSNRYIVDYLAAEVFARQPAHMQTFLLQTAILDRMCGSLCDAILLETMNDERGKMKSRSSPADSSFVIPHSSLSDSYSQIILEQLERANLFVVPLDDDRQWYRYHHLFAEVLRHRLTSGVPAETVAILHRRASVWYERQGLVAEAVHHAQMAADNERATDLIEQHGIRIIITGQVHTVLNWLSALPDGSIRARPLVCTVHALALLLTNQLKATEARIQDAERGILPDTPTDQAQVIQGRAAVLRAILVRYSGDFASCVAFAEQALRVLPATETVARTVAMLNAARAFLVSGDVTDANERLAIAVVAPIRASGNLFGALAAFTNLAQLQILQGRLRAAVATLHEAMQIASDPEVFRSLEGSPAYYFGMGTLLCEWNDLDAAEHHLAQGMDLVAGPLTVDAAYITQGYLALARLQQARGNLAAAQQTLDTFIALARRRGFVAHLIARGAAAQARLALAQGNLAAAVAWADASGLHPADDLSFPREAEELTLARVWIAQVGSASASFLLPQAMNLLDRLLEDATAKARYGSVLDVLIVRALGQRAQGTRSDALATIEHALTLAAPEGCIRRFVDEGPVMAAMLHAADARGIAPDYMSRLLATFPTQEGGSVQAEGAPARQHPSSAVPQPLVEPLSARELEVLRLIADGKSNAEVAQTLVIAISTVKTHTNSIFGKLQVTSRTQAIALARDLHLL